MDLRRVIAVSVVALVAVACASPEVPTEAAGTWVGTVTTEGNVTTVVNESGSVWGGTATLVEEMSIGVEAGDEPYMFGRVGAVAATDDRIYVLDEQVPVVRVYDKEGAYLFDIGRGGQGPGEFERPDFMALDGLGNAYVHGQGEIEVFSADGEHFDTWGLGTINEFNWFKTLNIGLDGTAYVPAILERDGMNVRTWKVGYTEIHEGAEGETRAVPDLGYETPVVETVTRTEAYVAVASISPPFVPLRLWAISPRGAIVVGNGDQYRFEVHQPDGTVILVEKPWDVVPVENSEAAWSRDMLRSSTIGKEVSGWNPDSQLPEHKPAFAQFVPDENGRIWVFRSGPGIRLPDCNEDATEAREFLERPCWVDSVLLDVFEVQGRYSGRVEMPGEFSGLHPPVLSPRPVFRDDVMIAAVEDELGTIRVKRYRLVLPGEQ